VLCDRSTQRPQHGDHARASLAARVRTGTSGEAVAISDARRAARRRPSRGELPSRCHWRNWVGYAAAGWSLLYGVLGLHWARDGAGFPFGRDSDPDADAAESILAHVRAATAAPVIAGLGLTGAPVAVALTRSRGHASTRRILQTVAWGTAVMLLVVVPDRRLVLSAAYAPIVLLRSRIGWSLAGSRNHPTGATLVFRNGTIPWPVLNQFLLLAGGLLWAGTAIVSTDGDGAASGWTTPRVAARWGRWVVAVAVAAPLPFAVTRWAWALGIPLGISEAFFREGQESGLWPVGGALATVAAGGAGLTLGLTQGWGEVFPGWAVGLAGKPVPPTLAVVPAALASVVVTSAGLGYVRALLRSGIPEEGWAVVVPGMLWPVWGAALSAAALAYYYRRRGDSV
jgi:hypothetical protein